MHIATLNGFLNKDTLTTIKSENIKIGLKEKRDAKFLNKKDLNKQNSLKNFFKIDKI